MRTIWPRTLGARARNVASPAFSLIELVMVVAIMAIISAVAIPRLGDSAVSQADDLNHAEGAWVNFGEDLVLIFDMYGKPESGGTVEIRVGDHYRTITRDTERVRASVSE